MGRSNGRICLLYQVDDYAFSYQASFKGKSISGTVTSEEEFYDAVESLLDTYMTDRIEVALKFFKYKGLRGICPKSLPISELSRRLLSLLTLTCGGKHGTELIHLPESGQILDQSNLFLTSYFIYRGEVTRHISKEIGRATSKSARHSKNSRPPTRFMDSSNYGP